MPVASHQAARHLLQKSRGFLLVSILPKGERRLLIDVHSRADLQAIVDTLRTRLGPVCVIEHAVLGMRTLAKGAE